MVQRYNIKSLFIFQEPSRHNSPTNVAFNQHNKNQFDDNDGDRLKHHNAPEMMEVASTLTDLKFDNKENQNEKNQQDQPSTTKKWYEGNVIRPVAFRATSKRPNQN